MDDNKQVNSNQVDQENKNVTTATQEKMAVKFPDWDLLPPALLVSRGKNES